MKRPYESPTIVALGEDVRTPEARELWARSRPQHAALSGHRTRRSRIEFVGWLALAVQTPEERVGSVYGSSPCPK